MTSAANGAVNGRKQSVVTMLKPVWTAAIGAAGALNGAGELVVSAAGLPSTKVSFTVGDL